MRRLWLLALLLPPLAACDADRATGPDEPEIEYLHYGNPENLLVNLGLALAARDLDELREHILYDGAPVDGSGYAPFAFRFDPLGEPPGQTFPVAIDGDCFLATLAQTALGGEDGLGGAVPALAQLDFEFTPQSYWDIEEEPFVDGDAAPPRTQLQFFDTDHAFTLAETYGEGVERLVVHEGALLHVVPLRIDGAWRYRLWKWRDVSERIPGDAVDTSLSRVLFLYLACPELLAP